jgi:hypothetical protein
MSEKKNGRPPKEIDWEKAAYFAETGASGSEIASYFDMHPDTFYSRIQSDLGEGYTSFAARNRKKAYIKLRNKQQEVALEGNTTMLIWLGKQYLEQSEKQDKNKDLDAAMETLKKFTQALSASNQSALGGHESAEEPTQDLPESPPSA